MFLWGYGKKPVAWNGLTLYVPTTQNDQIYSNNMSAVADLFECAWPFCGVALKDLRWSTNSFWRHYWQNGAVIPLAKSNTVKKKLSLIILLDFKYLY